MSEWFRPVCQRIVPEDVTVLSVICAVLALLVLAAIVLGFGPLRAWLGLTRASASDEDGLRVAWRLYHEIGRIRPPGAAISVSGVSALVITDAMVQPARDERPTQDLGAIAPLWKGSQ